MFKRRPPEHTQKTPFFLFFQNTNEVPFPISIQNENLQFYKNKMVIQIDYISTVFLH